MSAEQEPTIKEQGDAEDTEQLVKQDEMSFEEAEFFIEDVVAFVDDMEGEDWEVRIKAAIPEDHFLYCIWKHDGRVELNGRHHTEPGESQIQVFFPDCSWFVEQGKLIVTEADVKGNTVVFEPDEFGSLEVKSSPNHLKI